MVDASMEEFFASADVVKDAMDAITGDVSTKARTPPPESVPTGEKAPTKEEVLERLSSVAKGSSAVVSTPPKRGVSPIYAGVVEAPFTTPLTIISFGDPFAAFPQVVEYGSTLVVTPSSIPSFATNMPEVKLSPNEASEEVFKDLDDKPVVKTKVSDSKDTSSEEVYAMITGMDSIHLPFLLLFFFLVMSLFLI